MSDDTGIAEIEKKAKEAEDGLKLIQEEYQIKYGELNTLKSKIEKNKAEVIQTEKDKLLRTNLARAAAEGELLRTNLARAEAGKAEQAAAAAIQAAEAEKAAAIQAEQAAAAEKAAAIQAAAAEKDKLLITNLARATAEGELKRAEQYLSDFYADEGKKPSWWKWGTKEKINLTDKNFEIAFKRIDEIKNDVFTGSAEKKLKQELEKENFKIKKLYSDIRNLDEKEKELQKKNYNDLNKVLSINKGEKIKDLNNNLKDFIGLALNELNFDKIEGEKVKNLKEKILESAEKDKNFLTKKFDTSNYKYNDDDDIERLKRDIKNESDRLQTSLFNKIDNLESVSKGTIDEDIENCEEKKNDQKKIINDPTTKNEELKVAVEELNRLNGIVEECEKKRQNADKSNRDIQNLKSVSKKLKTAIKPATEARGLDKRDIDFSTSSASGNIKSISRDIRGAGKEKLDQARGIRKDAQEEIIKANKKKDLVNEIKEFQKNGEGSINKEITDLTEKTALDGDGSINKEITNLKKKTDLNGAESIKKEIKALEVQLVAEEAKPVKSASLILRRAKRQEIADKEKELADATTRLQEKKKELADATTRLQEKEKEKDKKEAELKAKIKETFEGGDSINIGSDVNELKEFDVGGTKYVASTDEYTKNIQAAEAIEQSVGLIGEEYTKEFENLGINEDTNYLRVINEENKILRKDLGIPPKKYENKYIENVIIQSIKKKESALKEEFTLGGEKGNLQNFNNLQIEEIRSTILVEIKKNEEKLNTALTNEAKGKKSNSSKLIAEKRQLIDNLTKLDKEQAIKERYDYLENSDNLDIIKNILTSQESGDLYEEKGDLSFEDFKNKKWFKGKKPEISEKLGYGKTGIVFTVASIILALLFVTVGGMAAYSLTTLNEEKPYWFYGKTIEGDVTFQKNTSLFLTISFFTFALLLFFLAYINFTKSFGSDFNKSDTSGVGNFFKGLNKNHTYFWRGIFVIFLLATAIYMGCLGVSHVWNGDNYSYFIAMCGGISFFFACYSLGKSKDINFLWELYHGGAKKNLEDEINKWQKNRADPILRKNVFQKLGEYKNQKEEFKELLDKEKGTNKELEEKLKDLPLIESQLKEHERDIKNKEETIGRIKAERNNAIKGS